MSRKLQNEQSISSVFFSEKGNSTRHTCKYKKHYFYVFNICCRDCHMATLFSWRKLFKKSNHQNYDTTKYKKNKVTLLSSTFKLTESKCFIFGLGTKIGYFYKPSFNSFLFLIIEVLSMLVKSSFFLKMLMLFWGIRNEKIT